MNRRARRNTDPHAPPRLQKVLASAGFGSRRQCEELIVAGRVEVDRQVVDELGSRVDPNTQELRVDGQRVKLPRLKYFALNKPEGIVSTARDPWARTRVIDLVDDPDRLFTVGRLDKSSSGLILVTNDGELANQLAHPSYEVSKTYRVTVAGKPTHETMRKLRKGIHLSEGRVSVDSVRLKKTHPSKSVLEIVLSEGRNREIRRMLAQVGHKVQQLKRIAIGSLRLGELPNGAYRELTRLEVQRLRRSVKARRRTPTSKPSPGKKRTSRPARQLSDSASGKRSTAKTVKGHRKTQRGSRRIAGRH
jgi:23S rRNA pseudouridine2605 synthase